MITATSKLHQEFMQDGAAKSYVQWLEARIEAMEKVLAGVEREKAAMEQAAGINHEMWAAAESEANRMAAALIAARSALRAGNAEMLRRVLEA